jgi:hypothetical protein
MVAAGAGAKGGECVSTNECHIVLSPSSNAYNYSGRST